MTVDLSKLEIRNIDDPWVIGRANGWHVVDGDRLESDRTLEADVVIIGSGAGGGVSAEILSRAGLKVIVVEAGCLRGSDDFRMDEGEAYRHLYQDGAQRATKDGGITILQGRSVGGSTTVNWTSSFRTPAETLDHWRNAFGVQGMDRQSLDPWFEKMEKRLSISKWVVEPNGNNSALQRGCDKLGWDSAVIPRNVSGCWNLGYCGMGCPINAKQSMLVTTLPAAMEAGATLLHCCSAERLVIEGERVTGVECHAMTPEKTRTGVRVSIRAGQVIAAGGGINTPALLLRSRVPDPAGRVGKRTFLHPTSVVYGDYNEEIAPYYGAPQSVYSDEFVWRDGVTGAAGYKLEMMPLHPGLAAAMQPDYGESHHARLARLPHLSAAIALMRDGFHEQSQGGTVELLEDGSPALDYPLNDYLMQGVRDSQLRMVEMHFAAGAKSVLPSHSSARDYSSLAEARRAIEGFRFEKHFMPLGSAHVMGGCTMGADEGYCVTDSNGKYRYLENLHIFDGSVFPTSLGVNPQLTIYGMTARNATRLAEQLTTA